MADSAAARTLTVLDSVKGIHFLVDFEGLNWHRLQRLVTRIIPRISASPAKSTTLERASTPDDCRLLVTKTHRQLQTVTASNCGTGEHVGPHIATH
jgi:hypothetical protein